MLAVKPSRRHLDAGTVQLPNDDNSGDAHRQLIGYLGLSLPMVLFVIHGFRSPEESPYLDSISAYYYSGAVVPFVGLLVALALFLFTYRGYSNRYYWADRTAAVVGGLAALGVAFFPANPPSDVAVPSWWTPTTGLLHYISATILFGTFAVFSLWLFRLRAPGAPLDSASRLRSQIHLVCGFLIIAAMAWTGTRAASGQSLFISESVALTAFAASWLVKGRASKTIGAAVRILF